MTGPGGGVDVRPEELHVGAVGLRRDAEELTAAGSAASAAVRSVLAAGEPLASAADDLARALDAALDTVATRTRDAAAGLDAAAAGYVGADADAARDLGGVLIPGLDTPGGT